MSVETDQKRLVTMTAIQRIHEAGYDFSNGHLKLVETLSHVRDSPQFAEELNVQATKALEKNVLCVVIFSGAAESIESAWVLEATDLTRLEGQTEQRPSLLIARLGDNEENLPLIVVPPNPT
jgi:hypothetical protein